MTAQYKVHGNVAVITLSNPPVNGLGFATRRGIVSGLSRALANSSASCANSCSRPIRAVC